jgi:uncharacterized RDD family membrane protein YckC
VTDRKLPSIQLSRLEGSGSGRAADDESPGYRPAIDLADPRRYEGVLLRRFCAAGIDFTIAVILSSVLWLANCMATIATLGLLSLPAFVLAPVVIHIAMATYLIGGPRGATFGMRAFGLRVANLDGRKLDHVQAFLMSAMYFATITVFFPVLAIGFFADRARLLHDIVVGAIVLRADPD